MLWFAIIIRKKLVDLLLANNGHLEKASASLRFSVLYLIFKNKQTNKQTVFVPTFVCVYIYIYIGTHTHTYIYRNKYVCTAKEK